MKASRKAREKQRRAAWRRQQEAKAAAAQSRPFRLDASKTWLGCCGVSVVRCCVTGYWWLELPGGGWARHHCAHTEE